MKKKFFFLTQYVGGPDEPLLDKYDLYNCFFNSQREFFLFLKKSNSTRRIRIPVNSDCVRRLIPKAYYQDFYSYRWPKAIQTEIVKKQILFVMEYR